MPFTNPIHPRPVASPLYPVFAAILLLSCLGVAQAQAALERVGDFALLDSQGRFHQLSRYRHRDALVVMALETDCRHYQQQLGAFQAIAAQFDGSGLSFVLLSSQPPAGGERSAGLPTLVDENSLIAEAISLRGSGDVVVLNPERLTAYYRGGTDGLKAALEQLQTDRIEDTVQAAWSGCAYTFQDFDAAATVAATPDYATEVAPIIRDNCVECHKQGGVGPFAMDSHIMVMGWSPMIREVVLNRRMPPTQVASGLLTSPDARGLSAGERQTLVHWIDAGAPPSPSGQDPLLEPPPNPEGSWQLGEPDLVVTAPAHSIPRTGVLDYYYQTVDLPLAEDRWLRAVQYRAGDPSVLHHLMTYVVAPGEDFWGEERQQPLATRRFVASYSPGTANVMTYPEGTGVLIPAGHRLAMQFHYVTNGQSTVDETRIGLYFQDPPEQGEVLLQAVGTRFTLPANTPEFPQRAEYLVERDLVLTGVRARMNYRGKHMRFLIADPQGVERVLFSIPAYNYGWQPHYRLNESVSVPAGSRLIVAGALDNSLSNPTNPDPGLVIKHGYESWEEMFTGYFSFFYPTR